MFMSPPVLIERRHANNVSFYDIKYQNGLTAGAFSAAAVQIEMHHSRKLEGFNAS